MGRTSTVPHKVIKSMAASDNTGDLGRCSMCLSEVKISRRDWEVACDDALLTDVREAVNGEEVYEDDGPPVGGILSAGSGMGGMFGELRS